MACDADAKTLPEMEFLDISLMKDSSLLLHATHSPFYWWIFKETILSYSGFENSSIFMNSILKKGKMRVED
jgi:hypothetical protein